MIENLEALEIDKNILSTVAWISRYYHTHLQSFELRNVVHYRTYVTHFYLEANRQNLLKDNNTKEKLGTYCKYITQSLHFVRPVPSRHRLRFGLQSLGLAQKDSLPLLMISSTTLFWITHTRAHFVIHVILEKRRKLQ
jgi:hypothetical protein